MTTPVDSQQFESFVPVYDDIPKTWEEGRQFLVEHLKKISNAVNAREIGYFLDVELLAGKQLFPTAPINANNQAQVFRQILRKVVDFGALPAVAGVPKSVVHGITVDANFTLIQLFAAATDPIGLTSIPLPWVEVQTPANGNIQLNLTSMFVQITTQSDRSNYSRCIVVIEYTQEL